MRRACLICLEETEATGGYHPNCLKDLFGRPTLPAIDVEVAKLHTLALAMVGRTTLSGIQQKISLHLATRKATFQLVVGRGRYILKPQSPTFPSLPENEQVTMRLAALVSIPIPPCGLIRLPDATLAYIATRFDRPPEGGKLRQEDFCQLAEKSPKEKYDASAELCGRLVRRYASEPLIELVKLFRLTLFAWWTGNGDMHLKNFSLLTGGDGLHRLSPAYDQICTRVVIENDNLALPIGGKKANLTRRTWVEYAKYCGIPAKVTTRIMKSVVDATDDALSVISRSFLSADMKKTYGRTVTNRSAVLE